MIKVLIVEDSMVKSQYLEYILSSDDGIKVIGKVSNGKLAIEFMEKNKPDIVTMDIEMPVMDGINATKRIMAENPLPIILVTAKRNLYNINTTMDALALGAVSVIDQPFGIGHSNEKEAHKNLVSMVKLLSKVKVVTRKQNTEIKTCVEKQNVPNTSAGSEIPNIDSFINRRIVTIGVSSGGPNALAKIFSSITQDFPYPIMVVQHITEGFLEYMVDWLGKLSSIPMHIAKDNEIVRAGHIYFAPDKYQMGVRNNRVKLTKPAKEDIICPSVDYLFDNLSENYGKDVIAFILTGMGSDGALGIKTLNEKGSLTIAQDRNSSLIFGMPAEAIKMGGVDYIQSDEQISKILEDIERIM